MFQCHVLQILSRSTGDLMLRDREVKKNRTKVRRTLRNTFWSRLARFFVNRENNRLVPGFRGTFPGENTVLSQVCVRKKPDQVLVVKNMTGSSTFTSSTGFYFSNYRCCEYRHGRRLPRDCGGKKEAEETRQRK